MAPVSAAGHMHFLELFQETISKFDKPDSEAFQLNDSLARMQLDIHSLEALYADCEMATRLLKQLLSQYHETHRRVRVDLRRLQNKYLQSSKQVQTT